MKMCRFALVGCFLLAGCQSSPKPDTAAGFGTKAVSLRGTYGVAQGGVTEPVLKVDETKTGHAFEERITGEWRLDPNVPHVATESEVKRALGLDSVTGFPVFGLANDQEMLLKVPAGWTHGELAAKSGFILVSGGKAVAAQKIELGGQ
ncbi:hypothetical protein [Granulicella tundricola]|uniref:Lipoprotein n=1 Tax=Granulicella tundricola (strain ATCC BAA-1859 / DSM 23138 / MP5ACTX9) TaxID=1198114 RepID=E8X1U0_GRATM|nr:hypothetical protein [Granulicella tundricola]ADW68009.1 hypothetical protein AciX9_0942 [Granulicella tundricola MP5ACTX9]